MSTTVIFLYFKYLIKNTKSSTKKKIMIIDSYIQNEKNKYKSKHAIMS